MAQLLRWDGPAAVIISRGLSPPKQRPTCAALCGRTSVTITRHWQMNRALMWRNSVFVPTEDGVAHIDVAPFPLLTQLAKMVPDPNGTVIDVSTLFQTSCLRLRVALVRRDGGAS